ncbi:hypothetical protein ACSVDE_07890 [Pseudalkalibacillus sp. Hm43]|uniref:hypothetical protein n=1 Tax=Pseudalkalibacillus sp. Hm43 TaxID=3450742 RepID=UPI003F424931
MMEFLYFPDDKTEYIPSVIMLIIFMAGAIIATIFIRKHSAKELSKFEQEHQSLSDEKVSEPSNERK